MSENSSKMPNSALVFCVVLALGKYFVIRIFTFNTHQCKQQVDLLNLRSHLFFVLFLCPLSFFIFGFVFIHTDLVYFFLFHVPGAFHMILYDAFW